MFLHTPHLARERVVIIGGGIAGLATALQLAPMPVTLLAKARLGTEAATPWAQGGIAAALGADDEPALHAADTVKAGAGLVDPAVAARITAAAPACIEDLIARGLAFDRDATGALALGLEAAHSRRRIVHAGGDGTGRAAIEALTLAAQGASHIDILDDVRAVELAMQDGAVTGVWAMRGGERLLLPARAVVLATGGIGGLYAHTTNPLGATGSGLALAARAGAVLRDMEFVQFHPTAIDAGADPMPLATEALRGEGATLINARGDRFMADIAGAELAPRDVVARAIWRQIAAGEKVYLDARNVALDRFPSVSALCHKAGIDAQQQPIPVRPAAHYHMGGVAVDERGRSSIAGLWACGEVAASGFHGANRLASNSLLEALAYARWIAQDIAGVKAARMAEPLLPAQTTVLEGSHLATAARVRKLMSNAVGVIRDQAGLEAAMMLLDGITADPLRPAQGADMALIGLLIATAARERVESRGAHFRSDHPQLAAMARSSHMTLAAARRHAAALWAQHSLAKALDAVS